MSACVCVWAVEVCLTDMSIGTFILVQNYVTRNNLITIIKIITEEWIV